MSSIILSARLEKSKVAFNKKHEVHLLVNLEGKKPENAKRNPLVLGVAIDLSSSMNEQNGQKIEDAKNGLLKLVDHLTDEDVLSIVAFSTTVWVPLEPTKMTQNAKEKAKAEIRSMHTHSSTNLSGATLETYEQVRKSAEMKLKESVSRALIFTDGQPTTGDQSTEGLVAIAKNHPKDTSLICFGYGPDYNADLMTAMAKVTGGEAYHIKTPDEFGPTLGRVLGGLLSCVAQKVKLTLKMKPDVKILEVLNDFDVKGNDDKTEAVITVDDVYSQEKRGVLVKLELPEMDKSDRPFKLGAASIEYQDLLANESCFEELALKIEYVKESEADKEADKEVAEKIAVMAAAKAQEEAMVLAQQGHFAQAKSVIRGAAMNLASVGTAFACSAAADLDKNVMGQLDPAQYKAGGAHYLHSNASSYRGGRGQTLGASKFMNTQHQSDTEAAFSGAPSPALPPGTFPGVGGPHVYGPMVPGYPHLPSDFGIVPGGTFPLNKPAVNMPKPNSPKPLSKKRTRR
jgi:Ca-activated chloride channel family protein